MFQKIGKRIAEGGQNHGGPRKEIAGVSVEANGRNPTLLGPPTLTVLDLERGWVPTWVTGSSGAWSSVGG